MTVWAIKKNGKYYDKEAGVFTEFDGERTSLFNSREDAKIYIESFARLENRAKAVRITMEEEKPTTIILKHNTEGYLQGEVLSWTSFKSKAKKFKIASYDDVEEIIEMFKRHGIEFPDPDYWDSRHSCGVEMIVED